MKYLFAVATAIVVITLCLGLSFFWRRILAPNVQEPPLVELSELEPLHAGLIAEPRILNERSAHCIGWFFDNGPQLLLLDRNSIGVGESGSRGMPRLNHQFDVQGLIDWQQPADRMVALIVEGRGPGRQVAVCLDREGQELWRYDPGFSFAKGVATPLWSDEELLGIVFGPDDAHRVIAKDLGGRDLWVWQASGSQHEYLTHASLPGLMVELMGNAEWIEYDTNSATIRAVPAPIASTAGVSRSFFTAQDGLLFPDRSGAPTLVLAGMAKMVDMKQLWIAGDDGDELFDRAGEEPFLIRENEQGDELWAILLPSEVQGLALLCQGGEGAMIAVALGDGSLLIIDEFGALLDQARLPGVEAGQGVTVSHFDAGPLDEGDFAVVADTDKGSFLWEITLRPATKAKSSTR